MTDSAVLPEAPSRRPWGQRLIEFAFWFGAPLGLMLLGALLALLFGAPHQRVIGIFAVTALTAGAYFMWRPSERWRIRRARAAGLLYTGLLALAGAAPTPPTTSDAPQRVEQQQTAQSAPSPALTPEQIEAQRAEQQAREQATLEQRRVDYLARLERELESATPASMLEGATTPETIVVTIAVFSVLAGLYQEGAVLELSAEQEQARQRFKRRLIALQVQVFPELRNRYGPALSHRVWENDMEVRTVGTAYRTIDLIWAGFAANRNIAQIHGELHENFKALRFSRARYFWYRGADRWTYYDLEAPSDRDLVVTRGGEFYTLTE
jgi:hypothetical protein